ncbi:type III pantothenate kinase [Saonia flava]|uniref:Type III pantothenate kinase n=1 Tax=Saonia flava TaxID=523696 RepID=A0A846QV39_9FLAO|nr:type III pantothenate kinase [Saonia flava]NJB71878.1 type III pantothenate kinase [Saonia flava]
MNLVIDCGNTIVKMAVFESGTVIFHEKTELTDFSKKVKKVCDAFPDITHGIVSSVGFLSKKDLAVLSLFCPVHLLSQASKVPFKNSYATPQTLGVDRIALATSAFYFNPRGNTLVIDAGTCVTYDIVNDYGEYLGGAISPGISIRYAAMHEHTAGLPLLEKRDSLDFIGNSTETSMHSGVVNGICNEIDGVINQYKSRFKDLTVILTGGDAQFLAKRLKNTIFANSKFLLEGLNYLLEYNKH